MVRRLVGFLIRDGAPWTTKTCLEKVGPSEILGDSMGMPGEGLKKKAFQGLQYVFADVSLPTNLT